MLRYILPLAAAQLLQAEIYTLTLKEAVDRSLRQNPDIALARLDELKSLEGIRVAKDPFSPKVGIGSGLAYSSGFPLSIEGAAPSVVRAQASQYLFNRQQTYAVLQAKETAKAAGFVTGSKRDEIAFRTASLYLDGDRAARLNTLAGKQVESLRKVLQTVRGRVQEGRELPLEEKRTSLELQKALQRQENLTADQDQAEQQLAVLLGYTGRDRARAAQVDRALPEVPATEEAAIQEAMVANKEIKRLQSALIAKGFEVKGRKCGTPAPCGPDGAVRAPGPV